MVENHFFQYHHHLPAGPQKSWQHWHIDVSISTGGKLGILLWARRALGKGLGSSSEMPLAKGKKNAMFEKSFQH